MKRNKKGFTMVELLAVITILGILTAIGTQAVTKYLEKAKRQNFETLEKDLKVASDNYLLDNSNKIPAIGSSTTISAKDLLQDGYLDAFQDPDNTGSKCSEISSQVTITRKAPAAGDLNPNISLDYKICVKCSKRTSKGC